MENYNKAIDDMERFCKKRKISFEQAINDKIAELIVRGKRHKKILDEAREEYKVYKAFRRKRFKV